MGHWGEGIGTDDAKLVGGGWAAVSDVWCVWHGGSAGVYCLCVSLHHLPGERDLQPRPSTRNLLGGPVTADVCSQKTSSYGRILMKCWNWTKEKLIKLAMFWGSLTFDLPKIKNKGRSILKQPSALCYSCWLSRYLGNWPARQMPSLSRYICSFPLLLVTWWSRCRSLLWSLLQFSLSQYLLPARRHRQSQT